MCGLWIFDGPPIYTIYRVTSYATVGFVYINIILLSILTCSSNIISNMSFLARLVSDNSGSLERIVLGHCPPQPPLTKKILHGIRVIVRGYRRVRFDLSSSINFRGMSCFPKLGVHTLYYGFMWRTLVRPLNFYIIFRFYHSSSLRLPITSYL